MNSEIYEYYCKCGTTFRAETWDPHELPRIWCPNCGDKMDFERFR